MKSLAEYLGVELDEKADPSDPYAPLFLTGTEFAEKVLASREFMQFVLNALVLGNIPAAVLIRLMDYAPGWGKPSERIEHTGKDGRPIETIKIIRVVVDPQLDDERALDGVDEAIH